jgi:hypothetical protein
MSRQSDKPTRDSDSQVVRVTARAIWGLTLLWAVTGVAVWLLFTLADDGWRYLHWVLGPSGVITLIVFVRGQWRADTFAKKQICTSIGFGLIDDAEEKDQIEVRIAGMFDRLTSVTVQGSTTVLPNVRCWLAETSEVLSRDSDNVEYRYSTVCFFETSATQFCSSGSFRLAPSNAVVYLLRRSISFIFNRPRSEFLLWYDEESAASRILTPEIRDWLGRHSCWSKVQPWTLVCKGGDTLIYRAGTVLNARDQAKYTQLNSEMHVFAGLLAESPSPKNLEGHKNEKSELDQLLEQKPIRCLSRFWLSRTRVQPFSFMLMLGIVVLFSGEPLEQFGKWFTELTGIAVDLNALLVLSATTVGLFTVVFWKKYWREPVKNRGLLKTGELVSGTVEHLKRRDDRSGTSGQYEIQVTYVILGETFSGKWRVSVADAGAGAFERISKQGEKVIVLVDPLNQNQIVLPELLTFS